MGALTGIVASNLLSMPLVSYVIASHHLETVAPDRLNDAVQAAIGSSAVLLVLQCGLGWLAPVLGGFVAALLAPGREWLSGALSSFLYIIIGIYTLMHGAQAEGASSVSLLILFSSPLAGFAGGALRGLQMKRRHGEGVG
ncbi:hypothetical protein [Mangrovitalea sediminis]|uniref:hypothetical protein n=1 Tax=Mangrovitalea sediminis TaxID=1982043 RepID=UPI000BE4C1EA|nr:hypothetical protein [Mangrovitalea sediminis]